MAGAKTRGARTLGPGLRFLVVASAIAVACGSDDDRPAVNPDTIGPGARPSVGVPNTGGSSGRPNQGNEGGEPSAEPGAPVVTLVSPTAANDPNEDEVLVYPEVEVVCRVEPSGVDGGFPVDKSSVNLELLDADGKTLESSSAAPTNTANEYSATFFLTDVKDNGAVSFRCSAYDTALPPKRGIDVVDTFYDQGPEITVVSPAPDSAHALRGNVRFEFDVEDSPVADGDVEDRVDEVSLEVKGVTIEGLERSSGTYEAFVDFTDRDVFADVPNGAVPVEIRATNSRSPEAAVRVHRYSFVIDGEGPRISITSPENEDVVGGQVALKFRVTDELSGVDPNSIVIELNGKEHHYGEGGTWAHQGADYVFSFDSVQAEKDSKIQATINIRAVDRVGNESDGESLIVYLDNVPPIVDLDPGPVREGRNERDGTYACSYAFDPVGSLSVNDLQDILDVERVRALVVDQTNAAKGQEIFYFASQDRESVYVYLQPDPSEPLLVDTNGDGYCDDLVANRNDLPFQHLNGIRPTGQAWFGSDEGDPESAPAVCRYDSAQEPSELCSPFGSDMTRVIQWWVDPNNPIVYAVGNLAQGASCTGTDWEIAQFLSEGWACMAGRAEDHVGNVGISQPLRLCYGGDCGAPPSCTDGCILPPKWEYTLLTD